MRPYEPRPVSFAGILEHRGWRLKHYYIALDAAGLHGAGMEPGVAMALAALPAIDVSAGRPGVGTLIEHRGRGALYVVLAWWDGENELPLRVFVRRTDDDAWHAAREHESICVWDLEVLWFEREAYVRTVLAPDVGDLDSAIARYLDRRPAGRTLDARDGRAVLTG